MPSHSSNLTRRLLCATAAVVSLVTASGCVQPAATVPVAMQPIPAGDARIWIYRDYQPSESPNMTAVYINGANAGYAQPAGGAFYRDVAPGNYHISVESYGTDVNQSANVALAAGQETFVKIESLRSWSSYGDRNNVGRDTFYARLMPAQIARAEIAHNPFYGGS